MALNPLSAGGLPPTGLQVLKSPLPSIEKRDPNLSYDYDLDKEQFYIRTPKGYTDGQTYGLLIFMSPADEFTELPPGWANVLDEKGLIFVAPQSVGNKQDMRRRSGLPVVAAKKVQELASIDPKRIYIGGFSGGGRVASQVAFAHPELFRGVIGNCGIDFPGHVDRIKATEPGDYGFFEGEESRKESTKQQTKFVIITGSKDFRYGNLLDVFHGGYEKDRYAAKLIDTPGMEHEICKGKQLKESLEFFDSVPNP